MDRLSTIALFFCSVLTALAQDASMLSRQQQFQENNFIPSNFIRELPKPPVERSGSFYLHEEWRQGSVYLFNKTTFQNLLLKYDLENEVLEIKTSDVDRLLPIKQVQAFKWLENGQEKFYLNTSNFFPKGAPTDGFFKLLVDGTILLASKTQTQLIKANYNVAFNVGEKSDRLEKTEKYYLIIDEKPIQLPKKRKDLWPYFGREADKVSIYAANNNLDVRQETDLIKIVAYYNQLEPTSPKIGK